MTVKTNQILQEVARKILTSPKFIEDVTDGIHGDLMLYRNDLIGDAAFSVRMIEEIDRRASNGIKA